MSAIRAPPTVSWAASSSGSSSGLRNASRKTASIRVCVALPPDPCDIVMRSSLTLGRRRRARSIRSSTCCSLLVWSGSASGSWRRPSAARPSCPSSVWARASSIQLLLMPSYWEKTAHGLNPTATGHSIVDPLPTGDVALGRL